MISNWQDSKAARMAAEAARDRQDEANKARAKAAMEGDIIVADRQPRSNGPSQASIDRLLRSTRKVYGDHEEWLDQVRQWAEGQTQRAVSDRITAVEADPRYRQATTAPASAQKPAQRQQSALKELGALAPGSKRRYAIDHEGQLRFYRVDAVNEGRWAGYTFMKEGVGGAYDDLVWHPMGPARREAAAKAIMESGANEALKRFGQEVGSCGHCGRTLTDETSRAYGIGPVCRGKLGW